MSIQELKEQFLQLKLSYRREENELNKLEKQNKDIDYLIFLQEGKKKRRSKYLIIALILVALTTIPLFFGLFTVAKLLILFPYYIFMFNKKIDNKVRANLFKKHMGYKCDKKLIKEYDASLFFMQRDINDEQKNIEDEMTGIKQKLDDILNSITLRGVSEEKLNSEIKCIVIDSLGKYITDTEPLAISDSIVEKQKSKRR